MCLYKKYENFYKWIYFYLHNSFLSNAVSPMCVATAIYFILRAYVYSLVYPDEKYIISVRKICLLWILEGGGGGKSQSLYYLSAPAFSFCYLLRFLKVVSPWKYNTKEVARICAEVILYINFSIVLDNDVVILFFRMLLQVTLIVLLFRHWNLKCQICNIFFSPNF